MSEEKELKDSMGFRELDTCSSCIYSKFVPYLDEGECHFDDKIVFTVWEGYSCDVWRLHKEEQP